MRTRVTSPGAFARFASEDVGLADPQALPLALSAWEHYERIGSPEGELAIAEAIVYLAIAPKSNAVYKAYGQAMRAAKETGSLTPPAHILNAPTKLMKDSGLRVLAMPMTMTRKKRFPARTTSRTACRAPNIIAPVERGFEREAAKRLAYFERIRAQREDGRDIDDDEGAGE